MAFRILWIRSVWLVAALPLMVLVPLFLACFVEVLLGAFVGMHIVAWLYLLITGHIAFRASCFLARRMQALSAELKALDRRLA